MKKILALFSVFFPLICIASFVSNEWKFYRDISVAGSGLQRASLDDQVYAHARKNLADLRVIEGEKNEVPFKMVVHDAEQKKETFPATLLNNSYIAGQFSMVIVDLGQSGHLTNQLKIHTTSENFQRSVKVYGSNNGTESWNVLQNSGYIYDFTDKKANFKSQSTTVNFPASTFRFLKLEVADPDGRPIKIDLVDAVNYVDSEAKQVPRQGQFESKENFQEKQTEVIVDLGQSGIETNRIELAVDFGNFNRQVSVYGSDDKNKWNYVGDGYIFRYSTPKFNGEQLSFSFSPNSQRYLKLVIRNQDNQPLKITGVSSFSLYRELVFTAEPNKKYRLYYGNDQATQPQYDLDKYFQYLDLENSKSATLSLETDNTNFVPALEPQKPLSERIPYLMPAIMILVSLGLLFLVYRFMKQES